MALGTASRPVPGYSYRSTHSRSPFVADIHHQLHSAAIHNHFRGQQEGVDRQVAEVALAHTVRGVEGAPPTSAATCSKGVGSLSRNGSTKFGAGNTGRRRLRILLGHRPTV